MLDKIKQNIKFPITSIKARNTLIGVMILKFGGGAVNIWFNMVLYIYSYYYQLDNTFDIANSSITMNYMMIPCSFIIFLSVYLAEKIGHLLLIKIGAIIFPLSFYLCSIASNFTLFVFFYVGIGVTSFTLMTIPIINCLWTHFRTSSGKTTGIALFAFEISNFFYYLLQLYLINPNNLEASIQIQQNNGDSIYLFDKNVTKNYQFTMQVTAIFVALFTIPGSFLIDYNDEDDEQFLNNNNIDNQTQLLQNQNYISKKKSIIQARNSLSLDNIILNLEKSLIHSTNKKQLEDKVNYEYNPHYKVNLVQTEQQKRQENFEDFLGVNLNNKIQEDEEEILDQIGTITTDQQFVCQSFRQGLLSFPFISICIISFIWALYSLFFSFNYKVYGMRQINDDFFLSYLGAVTACFKAVANLIWGPISDIYTPKQLYTFMSVVYGVMGLIFPFVSASYLGFIVSSTIFYIFNAGFLSIIGPVLINIFGLRIGEKLLPIKSGTLYLALVFIPGLQYLALNYFSFSDIFMFLGIIFIIPTIMALKLKRKYRWKTINKVEFEMSTL